jgi:hypothetical protein
MFFKIAKKNKDDPDEVKTLNVGDYIRHIDSGKIYKVYKIRTEGDIKHLKMPHLSVSGFRVFNKYRHRTLPWWTNPRDDFTFKCSYYATNNVNDFEIVPDMNNFVIERAFQQR